MDLKVNHAKLPQRLIHVYVDTRWQITLRRTKWGFNVYYFDMQTSHNVITPIVRDIVNSFTKRELSEGIDIEILLQRNSVHLKIQLNTAHADWNSQDISCAILQMLSTCKESFQLLPKRVARIPSNYLTLVTA